METPKWWEIREWFWIPCTTRETICLVVLCACKNMNLPFFEISSSMPFPSSHPSNLCASCNRAAWWLGDLPCPSSSLRQPTGTLNCHLTYCGVRFCRIKLSGLHKLKHERVIRALTAIRDIICANMPHTNLTPNKCVESKYLYVMASIITGLHWLTAICRAPFTAL